MTETGYVPFPMDLFFYGTLMDRDVLGGVVGRPFAQDRLKPATLAGWRRARALGQPYPIVLADPAGSVEGVVVDRLGPDDVARLCRYEGDGYDLVPTEVTQDGQKREAHFFRPDAVFKPDPQPWDFAQWVAEEKAAFLVRIARHLKAEAGMDNATDVEILEKRESFRGWYRLNTYRLRHSLHAGGMGKPIQRELLERGHSVAVLPYDPVRDAVVLIEQFRIGAYIGGDPAWLIEAVAGIVEPNETPEDVARREAIEEANCAITELAFAGKHYVSPGGTSEHCHVFVGRCDSAGIGGVHGLAEEGEDIRVFVAPFAEAKRLREDGRILAGPAVIALLWLELHRDELRRRWR